MADDPLLVYLHGFASSPGSNKARRFIGALTGYPVRLSVPDLNEGDFEGMTLSRALDLVERLTAQEAPGSVLLVGSSLGGYTAALFAARSDKVAALVAMAPAFDFAQRWAERLGPEEVERWQRQGSLPMHHYGLGREDRIGFGLLEDARTHDPFPAVDVPTLVIHGKGDDVVGCAGSERFADGKDNVTLELIDSDHMLSNSVDWIVERSLRFFEPWLSKREA
jgi:pimeloyl-ACP methyl ester carboxylesterase